MGNNFSADQIEKNFGHSVSVLSGPPGSNAPSYSSSPPPTSLGRTIVASPLPVYTRTTPRGFHHNVFIMYHGTSRQNAVSIIKTGFRPSAGGNLGAGVYVSKDFNKAQNFGECIFKLLVYAGEEYAKMTDPWFAQKRLSTFCNLIVFVLKAK